MFEGIPAHGQYPRDGLECWDLIVRDMGNACFEKVRKGMSRSVDTSVENGASLARRIYNHPHPDQLHDGESECN